MITAKEFSHYRLKEKIWTLYKKGEFVTGIQYYGHKINLYLLDGYFVEAFYSHRKDRIEKIDILNPKNSRLNFYLDQVNLTDLKGVIG